MGPQVRKIPKSNSKMMFHLIIKSMKKNNFVFKYI